MKRVLGRLLLGAAALALGGCDTSTPPSDPGDQSPAIPAMPLNVSAYPGPGVDQITVAWPAVSGATSYNVYWGTSSGVTTQNGIKVTVSANGFSHTGLTPNSTYYYVVAAVNNAGEGGASPTVHATASDIGVSKMCPSVGVLQGSAIALGVTVVSRYQMSGVTANVDGRSTALAFDPNSPVCGVIGNGFPLWVGTISLAGLPKGPITLSLSATDVLGNIATVSYVFMHDEPPTLTIAAPDDFYVARPTLRVAVSCLDDDPKGCTSLTVKAGGATLASAQGSIDQAVSLAAYDGQSLALTFQGTDSAGQTTTVSRRVFVESSSQLTEVAAVNGLILDVQPDRILFLNESTGGNALTIHDRVSGGDVVIYDQAGHNLEDALLTPLGAMFLEDVNNPFLRSLHEWQGGALTDLGKASASLLVIKGPYALFTLPAGLTRRDVLAGVNTLVSTGAANVGYDVASNGDVVYWTNGTNDQVFRFRGGLSTQLTTDAMQNIDPITDSVNVVYLKNKQVTSYDTLGEHVLTPGDFGGRSSGQDYQVANGWVAYTKSGVASDRQVWSHSPTGDDAQVTHFGTSSSINALGPNGEIALINAFGGASRRYLALPDYSTIPRDISSDLGSAFFQNGNLFITIGRSLFQVNP
jgi:hypothetical protein